jgi:hypothetical protein
MLSNPLSNPQTYAGAFCVWLAVWLAVDRLASRRPNWRASNARLALAYFTLAAFAALSIGNAIAVIAGYRLAS